MSENDVLNAAAFEKVNAEQMGWAVSDTENIDKNSYEINKPGQGI